MDLRILIIVQISIIHQQVQGACDQPLTFKVIKNSYLKGFNNKIILNVSEKICIENCLSETNFTCSSLEYWYSSNSCHLSSETRFTQPDAFEEISSTVDYFDNNCIDNLKGACDQPLTFKISRNSFLKGFNNKIILNVSKKICIEDCLSETNFTCSSVEYWYSNNSCHLSSETRFTQPDAFEEISSRVDYFDNDCIDNLRDQWENCTGSYQTECESDFINFELVSLHRILERPFFTLRSNDSLSCLELCRFNRSCSSLVYNFYSKTCYFYTKVEEPGFLLEKNFKTDFYGKICLKSQPQCRTKWAYEVIHGKELIHFDKNNNHNLSFNHQLIFVLSRAECILACIEETTFTCRSAAYNTRTRSCSLNRYHRYSLQNNFILKDNVDLEYLENSCYEEEREFCHFTQLSGKTLFQVDLEVPYDVADDGACKLRCLQETNFICRSYVYAHNKCSLSHHSSSSAIYKKVFLSSLFAVKEVQNCFHVMVGCDNFTMTTNIKTNMLFNGKIYAENSTECAENINNSLEFSLSMSLRDLQICNIHKMDDGNFWNIVTIQVYPLVHTYADRSFRVQCIFELTKTIEMVPFQISDEGQLFTASYKGYAPKPQIEMKILDLNGHPAKNASIGDRLKIQIEAQTTDLAGLYLKKLVAYSKDRLMNITLLNNGCPVELMVELIKENTNPAVAEVYLEVFIFSYDDDGIILEAVVVPCYVKCETIDCNAEENKQRQYRQVDSDVFLNANTLTMIETLKIKMKDLRMD